MRKRTRYLVLGGLWFGVAAIQVYHLRTGEVGWAWSTVLALVVYALGACYYFGTAVKSADGLPGRFRDAE